MEKFFKMVRRFNKAYGLFINSKPTLIEEADYNLKYEIMREEVEEYINACRENNLKEVADSLVDQMYVLIGLIIAHGISEKRFKKMFREVHRSNMSKLDESGKPIYREDGKVLKGPNYSPPDISKFL